MKDAISLKQAILTTLSYFDILDLPLSVGEIETYLYSWSAPKESISAALEELISEGKIEYFDEFYLLSGRREIAEKRTGNRKARTRLWKRAKAFAPLLAACPFVRMVAVSNSLAFGNAGDGSDIDLFVVAVNGRLYSARFFMKLFTQIFGVRAHGEKLAGRFCQNFFVTEKSLSLRKVAHDFDPHLAYFIATMKPLFGAEVYEKFIVANEPWILPYLKHPIRRQTGNLRLAYRQAGGHFVARFFQKILEVLLIFWPSERLFAKILRKRDAKFRDRCMAGGRSIANRSAKTLSAVMNSEMFKFHANDNRKEIAERFLAK